MRSDNDKQEYRKSADEALGRLNRELRAITHCNETLMRATDEANLLRQVCQIICDDAGYRMAWVGYIKDDDAKTIDPVGSAGKDEGYVATGAFTWADTPRGRGPAGTAVRSGQASFFQDFASDPAALPWRENALQRGYRSCIGLPLKDETAVVFGVLVIYSIEPNSFTGDEIRLLEQLAADLSFGIYTLRARTELKRTEAELRESEGRYRMAESIGHVGSWEYQIQTTKFWGSDEAKRIYGFDPNQHDFSTDEVEKCIPERERVHQALIDLIESDKPYNLEFEIRPRNSSEPKFIHSIAQLIRDDKGAPLKIVGVLHDITDRKKSEETLRRMNEELDQRVKERTKELETKNSQLEAMNKGFVGRELTMIDLKKQIKTLEARLAQGR